MKIIQHTVAALCSLGLATCAFTLAHPNYHHLKSMAFELLDRKQAASTLFIQENFVAGTLFYGKIMKNYIDSLIGENKEKEKAFPLKSNSDLSPLLERVGVSQFVLLGEASHGTHEYYTWRTQISKRLIREKGFRFIAVEGDWPDCYRLNLYVKGHDKVHKDAASLLEEFKRWPTWMWANWEVASLLEWMKEHNKNLPENEKAGFYGLDVYSLWDSIELLVSYLQEHDPEAAKTARRALRCFQPYAENEQEYANAQVSLSASCKEPVLKLLNEVRRKANTYDHDPEAPLNTTQNALVAANAENYYASMVRFDNESWNIRDRHMAETLNEIVNYHGRNTKAIVWEHNTHIGDARYTDMKLAGDINVGQLVREKYGDKNVVLVGFGSYQGSVIAGEGWGSEMKRVKVPEAKKGSVEALLHEESMENRLLIFDKSNKNERFKSEMPHRAIGVVYNPDYEKYGNYVPSVLNGRYDAFIYLDYTKALHAMHLKADGHKIPDTYPFEF